MRSKTTNKFSAGVWARPVRMTFEHEGRPRCAEAFDHADSRLSVDANSLRNSQGLRGERMLRKD